MSDFIIGQIFEGEYTPEAAQWCNENRAYIEELDSVDGVRRFQIVAVPEPTLSEVRTSALSRIDSATSEAILAGFEYEVETGEGKDVLHFSYLADDQQNFSDTANGALLAMQGVESVPSSVKWNGWRNHTPEYKGDLVRLVLDVPSFLMLYTQGALVHKAVQMEIGGQRKAAIEAAATVEEINALMQEWGI